MTQSDYRLFVQYCRTKIHFNSWEFDLRKTRLRLNESSFKRRRDRVFFTRLNNLIPNESVQDEFLVSSFINNTSAWIGDLLEERIVDIHLKRMKNINSILYVFKNDVDKIHDYMLEESKQFKEMLTPDGKSPIIVGKMVLQHETVSILDKVFNFTRYGNDDPLWEKQRLVYHKYSILIENIIGEHKNEILKTVKPLIEAIN